MSKFIIPFSILLGSYLFQNAVILPLESMIRVDDNVDLVSLLFIPHGVKVALVLILGLNVLPAIFLAQLFNGIILENILNLDIQIILGALGGTLCFLPPLLLCNFYFRQSVFSSPIFQKMSTINNLSLFLIFSFMASVLNSVFHATMHGFNFELFAVMYLLGDVCGAILIFFVFILVFRPYVLRLVRKGAFHE